MRARIRGAAASVLAASAIVLAVTAPVGAQERKPAQSVGALTESQQEANAILMRMARFLATTQRFAVTVSGVYDAVQSNGQKIEFGDVRKVTVSRPDKLRMETERSDGAKAVTVFGGKEITLVDAGSNVYATAPQPGGLDDAIVHFVRDLGMRMPLAMMLVSQLPAELESRVRSVDYVERTSINGAPAHHLAVRAQTVDFQIWVSDGERPLPQRIVITYTQAPGEPQFRARFSNWNLAPVIAEATFALKPPERAQRVAFAAQLSQTAVTADRKPAAAQGGAK